MDGISNTSSSINRSPLVMPTRLATSFSILNPTWSSLAPLVRLYTFKRLSRQMPPHPLHNLKASPPSTSIIMSAPSSQATTSGFIGFGTRQLGTAEVKNLLLFDEFYKHFKVFCFFSFFASQYQYFFKLNQITNQQAIQLLGQLVGPVWLASPIIDIGKMLLRYYNHFLFKKIFKKWKYKKKEKILNPLLSLITTHNGCSGWGWKHDHGEPLQSPIRVRVACHRSHQYSPIGNEDPWARASGPRRA